MALTYAQKRYIQEHALRASIDDMARALHISADDVRLHLRKNPQLLQKSSEKSSSESKPPIRGEQLAYMAVLAIIVIAVYANGMFSKFVSDDIYVIVNEEQRFKTLDYFLVHPTNLLRNLQYFIAYHVSGLTPFVFRFFNIFFHIGYVTMVYLLMPFFSHRRYLPFLVATFAAVHPMMIESVTWISGGIYAQAAFFALLSLYCYIRHTKNGRISWYVSSLLIYLVAVSSSEKIIVFPFIILLYELTFGSIKRSFLKVGGFFAISLLWGLVILQYVNERLDYLQVVNGSSARIQFNNPLIQIPVAMATYMKLFLWPRHLTLYQSEFNFVWQIFALYVGATIAYFSVALASFHKNRSVFFFMLFFFISLLTTMNPFGLSWIVAERYSYFGSVGLYFSFVTLLYKLIESKKWETLGWSIAVILLVAFSIRTVVRNIDWHSEDNLWVATAKASPSDPKTHNNLGDVYARQGNLQKAGESFARALQINPNYPDATHNLANIYKMSGDNKAALELFTRATELNPNIWQSFLNIAAIHYEEERFEDALAAALRAHEIRPQSAQIQSNIGLIYYRLGDFAKAKQFFTQALALDPNDQTAQQGLQIPELR